MAQLTVKHKALGGLLVREDRFEPTVFGGLRRVSRAYEVKLSLPQAITYAVRADAQYGP